MSFDALLLNQSDKSKLCINYKEEDGMKEEDAQKQDPQEIQAET